ncbi:hypothetical protein BCR44DRAFT_199222 [Catenaria anguillulae PL171]|uniref:BTB domain-containing protein n=1 Tax=Catenaria anguillulae PL171 TaxID=765915 RepID=A0A1Y2HGT4_9FUNG|nr:hypothetical protein BCR44DRAFT_199222 [Catenaria anguillulae PL171]
MASSSTPSAAPPSLRRALTTVPTTSSLLHGGHHGSAHELHHHRHLTSGTATAGISPLSIEQVGESHLEYTVRWRVHPWESLEPMTEFRSPTFVVDELPWSLKLFKGRVHHPGALSLYLGCDARMTGVHKRVRITFMVENAQNARLPGYSLVEQPVWFSSDHLTWGEENLCLLDQITPLIHADTLALSVNVQILQVTAETPPTPPSPLNNLFASRAFADAILRVSSDEDESAIEIPIHRAILASQSAYFATMFYTSQFAESIAHHSSAVPDSLQSLSPPIIQIRGTDPGAFMHLISFMYRQPMHPLGDANEQSIPNHAGSATAGLVDELITTLSLDELTVCLATSHMYQVTTWTDLLLCAVRLLVNDRNVWRVWELGELYECTKTANKAKHYVAAHFSRICSNLLAKRLTRQASIVGMASIGAGQRSRYSTGLSSSTGPSGSTISMHSSSIPGIQWQHASSSLLTSISASRMRTLLEMDPINCDNEEQMFELFSEWVMVCYVKPGAYGGSIVQAHTPHPFASPLPRQQLEVSTRRTVSRGTSPVSPGFPAASTLAGGPPTRATYGHLHQAPHEAVEPPRSSRFASERQQALPSTATATSTASPSQARSTPNLAVSTSPSAIHSHSRRHQSATLVSSPTHQSLSTPLEDAHTVIADLIRLIRFPVMRKEYLVTTVEGADHLMCWPEVRERLRETYRALLVPDQVEGEAAIQWVPRRRVVVGIWPDGQDGKGECEGGNGCAVV